MSVERRGFSSATFRVPLLGLWLLSEHNWGPTLRRQLVEGNRLSSSMEERVLTILFLDIVKYSAMAERLAPRKLLVLVNSFLEVRSFVVPFTA